MEAKCQNCKFFEKENGFCRRFPPSPTVTRNTFKQKFVVESMFPIIRKPETDWCAEFTEDTKDKK